MNKKDGQKGMDATLGNGEGTIGLHGYRMGGILGSFRLERTTSLVICILCKIVWSGRKSNCSLVGINAGGSGQRVGGKDCSSFDLTMRPQIAQRKPRGSRQGRKPLYGCLFIHPYVPCSTHGSCRDVHKARVQVDLDIGFSGPFARPLNGAISDRRPEASTPGC